MQVCRALLMTLMGAPLLTATWLAAVLFAETASAGPLEPQACATLKSEHQDLVAAGAQSDMDRGPDWAKANLTPDRLQRVERLIALKEQLSFRCGVMLTARPNVKEPPPEPKEGASKESAAKETANPGDDLIDALGLSPTPAAKIPAPKKKSDASPAATKKKRPADPQGQ